MPVAVMMVAATQEPCARDVHGQAKTGDRDRLAEVDRDRREDAAHGFIADQQCDHREDDRAGEAGEVAELARAEAEIGIVGMFSGVGIGERREQERARVRARYAARRRRARWSRTAGRRQFPRSSWPRRARSPPMSCARFSRVRRQETHADGKSKRRRSRSSRPSFQVGADNIEELLRRFGV